VVRLVPLTEIAGVGSWGGSYGPVSTSSLGTVGIWGFFLRTGVHLVIDTHGELLE